MLAACALEPSVLADGTRCLTEEVRRRIFMAEKVLLTVVRTAPLHGDKLAKGLVRVSVANEKTKGLGQNLDGASISRIQPTNLYSPVRPPF